MVESVNRSLLGYGFIQNSNSITPKCNTVEYESIGLEVTRYYHFFDCTKNARIVLQIK